MATENDLAAALQRAGLLATDDPGRCLAASRDCSWLSPVLSAHLPQESAAAVAFPRDVDQLATAVGLAHRRGMPVTMRGKGTGNYGQAVPLCGGLVIDVCGMVRVPGMVKGWAAQTYLVNTSNWCDPLKQKEAAAALLAQGADVLTQHQDCQATVIEAAKGAGKYVVGYHYDAQSLDPSGWLTGSAWHWTPVYESIIKTVLAGQFRGSKYNANWVGTFADHDNPLQLAPFGSALSSDVKTKILAEEQTLQQPGASVFKGPITCQDGTTLYPAGVTPTYAQINDISCLVKGVVGTLPKS